MSATARSKPKNISEDAEANEGFQAPKNTGLFLIYRIKKYFPDNCASHGPTRTGGGGIAAIPW